MKKWYPDFRFFILTPDFSLRSYQPPAILIFLSSF